MADKNNNYNKWKRRLSSYWKEDIDIHDYDYEKYYNDNPIKAEEQLNNILNGKAGHFPDGGKSGTYKKKSHPTYPDLGSKSWNDKETEFNISDRQLEDSDKILDYLGSDYDYNNGGTKVMYNGSRVLPNITVTPNGNKINMKSNKTNTGFVYTDRLKLGGERRKARFGLKGTSGKYYGSYDTKEERDEAAKALGLDISKATTITGNDNVAKNLEDVQDFSKVLPEVEVIARPNTVRQNGRDIVMTDDNMRYVSGVRQSDTDIHKGYGDRALADLALGEGVGTLMALSGAAAPLATLLGIPTGMAGSMMWDDTYNYITGRDWNKDVHKGVDWYNSKVPSYLQLDDIQRNILEPMFNPGGVAGNVAGFGVGNKIPNVYNGLRTTYNNYNLARALNEASLAKGNVPIEYNIPANESVNPVFNETKFGERTINDLLRRATEPTSRLAEAERAGIPRGERNNISKPLKHFGKLEMEDHSYKSYPDLTDYIGDGGESIVYGNGDKVYKVMRSPLVGLSKYENFNENGFNINNIGDFIRQYVNPRNRHPVFEPINFEGIVSLNDELFPVISQKRVNPIPHALSREQVNNIANQFQQLMKEYNYKPTFNISKIINRGYKNDLGTIGDISFRNMGYNDKGELRIIDMLTDKKLLGGKKAKLGTKQNPTELPEVTVTPKNIKLYTYPYFDSDYPISHSAIEVNGYDNDTPGLYADFSVSKKMGDKDYNLFTNNCSDETARILNDAINLNMDTSGLVTPNKVKEAVLNSNRDYKKYGDNLIKIPVNQIEFSKALDAIYDFYDRNEYYYNSKKLGGTNKQLTPNVIRGGQAKPIGNNLYYMNGLKHEQGGIDIGKDLEVEGGEVVQMTPKNIKVYSAQPILNGISPAKAVMGGASPNKVFNMQEQYKDRMGLNDDGTRKKTKAEYGTNKKQNKNYVDPGEQARNVVKTIYPWLVNPVITGAIKGIKALKERNNRGNFGGGTTSGGGVSGRMDGKDYPKENIKQKGDTIWVPIIGEETFNDAFKDARKRGDKKFEFNGKQYTTEIGNDPRANEYGERRTRPVIKGVVPIVTDKEDKNKKKKAVGGTYTVNGKLRMVHFTGERKKADLGTEEPIGYNRKPFVTYGPFDMTPFALNGSKDNTAYDGVIGHNNKIVDGNTTTARIAPSIDNSISGYSSDYIPTKSIIDTPVRYDARKETNKPSVTTSTITPITVESKTPVTYETNNDGSLKYDTSAPKLNFDYKIDTKKVIDSNKLVYPDRRTNLDKFKDYVKSNIVPFAKTNASDLIGIGSNIAGSAINYITNRNAIRRMQAPKAPISNVASKLKTRININPQLDELRNQLGAFERATNANTQSSAVAQNRINAARLNKIANTNTLYGNKENAETELINADIQNRQNVANKNIDAYNLYQDKLTDYYNRISELKSENLTNLVSGINSSIQNTLINREKRKQAKNNLIATAITAPNAVDLFREALSGKNPRFTKMFNNLFD